MSYKEMAKSLIDQIPDSKMYYIVAYLQGAAGLHKKCKKHIAYKE